jgi:GTPase SAR1 family protein
MGRLSSVKANEVKVLLESFVHVLIGLRKTGKTTLFRDLVHEHFNGDMSKGLLLGFEKGYQALDGLHATDVEDWSDFDEIITELIDKRKELPYRLLAFDTIDEMVNMAESEAIRYFNKKTNTKATTINEAGGGFGRGKAHAKKLIRDAISSLLKAGYGVVFIGHSKDKTIKEKSGVEYSQLSCSLTNDYTDIFMDMADIITFLTIEKEVSDKTVVGSKVYMNFRSDGQIDCGARFKELPDRIEWGAKNYLAVFEDAVKSSMLKPVDNLSKIAKIQREEFEDVAEKNIEKMSKKPLDELVEYIQANFATLENDKKTKAKAIVKREGWTGFDGLKESDYTAVEEIYNIMIG